MRIKTISVLLMLMLTSVFFAGCIGNDEPVIEETIPVVNETPEEVEEIPIEEPVEELPAVDPQTHMLKLEYYMRQTTLEINKSDTVIWWNYDDDHKFKFSSEDELWESTWIVPGKKFIYTFNESGTYNFSVLGEPRMSGSIIVN